MCRTIRVAILDHNYHILYIEDFEEKLLEEYAGDIERYIEANYPFSNYSFEVIDDACYKPSHYEDPVTINFEDLI